MNDHILPTPSIRFVGQLEDHGDPMDGDLAVDASRVVQCRVGGQWAPVVEVDPQAASDERAAQIIREYEAAGLTPPTFTPSN